MNLQYLYRPAETLPTERKSLLFLLHGYGSNKEDLFSFAAEIPKNLDVISLEAPISLPFGGYAWYDINFTNAQEFNDTVQAQKSMQLILADIQSHADQLGYLKEDKVQLCGFSQGGILSYALSLHNPEKFSKTLCLSAYPAEDVIGGIEEQKDFSGLSFYISHGEEDAVIPIEWARNGPVLLKSLGIRCTYKEYHSGHGINPENFRDLIQFLAEK